MDVTGANHVSIFESLRRSIQRLVARLERVSDGQLFACSILWVVIAGLALQLVVLPYITPFAHAGHGLIANLDSPGFHLMAIEMAETVRTVGFEDWGHWQGYDYNYPVAITSLFYLIYPEPWIQLPFNGVLFGVILVSVRNIVAILADSRGIALASLLPFFIFPSFVLIWGQPHRDLITGTGFSLVLYALALATYSTRKAAWLPALVMLAGVGMGLIWLSRPYALSLVAAATVAFATFAVFGRQSRRGRLLAVTAVVLVAAVVNIKGWTTEVRARVDLSSAATVPGVARTAPAEPVRTAPAEPVRTAPGEPVRTAPAEPEGQAADASAATAARESATASVSDDSPSGWSWWPRSRRVVSSTAVSRAANCFPPPSRTADTLLYNLCHVREGMISAAQLAGASSGYDYDIRLRSAEDFVAYTPRALAFGLLEPGPRRWGTERTTLGRLATFFVPFEMITAYAAFLLALLFGRRRLARLHVWAVGAFCITYISIYAFAMPQLGGLYRMRVFAFAVVISTALAVALPRALAPGERGSDSLH